MEQTKKYDIHLIIPAESFHEALMAVHTIKGVTYCTAVHKEDDSVIHCKEMRQENGESAKA